MQMSQEYIFSGIEVAWSTILKLMENLACCLQPKDKVELEMKA